MTILLLLLPTSSQSNKFRRNEKLTRKLLRIRRFEWRRSNSKMKPTLTWMTRLPPKLCKCRQLKCAGFFFLRWMHLLCWMERRLSYALNVSADDDVEEKEEEEGRRHKTWMDGEKRMRERERAETASKLEHNIRVTRHARYVRYWSALSSLKQVSKQVYSPPLPSFSYKCSSSSSS